jgi:hypothetical protein
MPGIPKTHASSITELAPRPSSAANNINGTANISKNVYRLPQMLTANLCIPKAVAVTMATATDISRTNSAIANQSGID